MSRTLQTAIHEVVHRDPRIEWSISVRDAVGSQIAGSDAERVAQIASVGKLLLLVEVARQCEAGTMSGDDVLSRDPALHVADSGIWQHLRIDALPIGDLCVLIAAVSDNLATNVLVEHVGLQRVRESARALGLTRTTLHDYVRDHRGPDDAPSLATGSAAELSQLMSRMVGKELVSPAVSTQLAAWLSTGVDLSMVASAFGLDPLSHAESARDLFLCNKTGTDEDVRAETGAVGQGGEVYSYAVIANWAASTSGMPEVAMAGMHRIGTALRETIQRGSASRT